MTLVAIIEASHDDNGIIWPESVAPFIVGIINLRVNDEACDLKCEEIYTDLREKGIDVLYDNRDESIGTKFADMDLIGLPWQIIVGPRSLKEDKIEIKNRSSGIKEILHIDDALKRIFG